LFKKAIRLNPDSAELYHSLGYMHYHSGDMEEAKRHYKKAMELNPKFAKPYHDMAVIYYSEGRYKMAIDHCDQAVVLGFRDNALLSALEAHR